MCTYLKITNLSLTELTARKMKFFSKDFFRKCDQIRRNLRIWLHLLKKSLMENFIFCAMTTGTRWIVHKLIALNNCIDKCRLCNQQIDSSITYIPRKKLSKLPLLEKKIFSEKLLTQKSTTRIHLDEVRELISFFLSFFLSFLLACFLYIYLQSKIFQLIYNKYSGNLHQLN